MEKEIDKDAETKNQKVGLENTILGTSASMLGFCFVVISYLNASELGKKTIIDELTMVAMVAFMANCVFSFLSIQKTRFQSHRFVNFTSFIFLVGLVILFGIVILIAFGLTGVVGV
jgi:O-antigen/teichoic acid export membrane protein